jgi:hypothetical protein
MPNGGPVNCGTCGFNAKNKGESGYGHAYDAEPDFCGLRGIPIMTPLYTYCGNHTCLRLARDPIPVGPVITADAQQPFSRMIWKRSPDTEEIRHHLLDLLREIQERPTCEGFDSVDIEATVIWQLGEFRESRAVEQLRRIASWSPDANAPDPLEGSGLKELAQEALAKIAASMDNGNKDFETA